MVKKSSPPSSPRSKKTSRAWIKTLAVTSIASPRSIFRRNNSSHLKNDDSATTATANSPSGTAPGTPSPGLQMIPLQTLTTLSHMVEFLEENHRREEGLYQKDGLHLETSDLVAFCLANQQQQMPDLALYNPHSITHAIKTILADRFEPLIPYSISHQLLDQLFSETGRGTDTEDHDRSTQRFHSILPEKFKQIRATTREFLKIFLLHLNHVLRVLLNTQTNQEYHSH